MRGRIGGVVALVLARASIYAWFGPGLVLDDWVLMGKTAFEGPFQTLARTNNASARPGAWVSFNVIYGLSGRYPGVLFALVTLLNVAAAVLLFLLLRRYVSETAAFLVTAVWILIPSHNSLTVWGGASQALTALVLLLAGLLALSYGRWILTALLFGASVLTYQATIPLALVAAAVLPGPASGRDRVKIGVTVLVATIWLWLHPTYPVELRIPNPFTLWSAHFGDGLFGTEHALPLLRTTVAVAVVALVVVCVVSWLRGDRDHETGPHLVVLGLAVMAIGLPVTLTTGSAAHGMADRILGISTIGSAMVLVGIGQLLHRRRHEVAYGAAAALVAICVVGQVVSLRAWSETGQDTIRLMRYLHAESDRAGSEHWVVGPAFHRRDGVAGPQYEATQFAFRLYFGEHATGTLRAAQLPEDFVATQPGERLVRWDQVPGVVASDDDATDSDR